MAYFQWTQSTQLKYETGCSTIAGVLLLRNLLIFNVIKTIVSMGNAVGGLLLDSQ